MSVSGLPRELAEFDADLRRLLFAQRTIDRIGSSGGFMEPNRERVPTFGEDIKTAILARVDRYLEARLPTWNAEHDAAEVARAGTIASSEPTALELARRSVFERAVHTITVDTAPVDIRHASISALCLPVRAENALAKAGIDTVVQLIDQTEGELLRRPFFGRVCLQGTLKALAEHGLRLKRDDEWRQRTRSPFAMMHASPDETKHWQRLVAGTWQIVIPRGDRFVLYSGNHPDVSCSSYEDALREADALVCAPVSS